MNMELSNKIGREILIQKLNKESYKRITLSFYRYVTILNPLEFRNALYLKLNFIQCFGRIYIAKEGINAQMSVPEHKYSNLLDLLEEFQELKNIPIKLALEDNGKSFFKLTIKVRLKIVADGLDENEFDLTNTGKHLNAIEFHHQLENEDAIVIDMRNHYESEIGRFENAICPDADTFKEAIQKVVTELANKKDKKLLLYCTGGIRCEKASAYLKYKGFSDVNQLQGGIIEYANETKKAGLTSKFIGKNFVFDQRLGEKVDGQVISQCHQCVSPCDTHINCANDDCHLLFIQCLACCEKYNACCSDECMKITKLPEATRLQYRQINQLKYSESKIYKSRLRPHLKIQNKE